jgi:glycosyltransferase involved in cell wall biosynthesis
MTTQQTDRPVRSEIAQPYRIDFALIVLTGNITRYKIVRPLVDKDTSVKARWYPIRTWFEGDPLRIFPGFLRLRLRHFLDSWPAYFNPPADAIVIHAFETFYIYVALKRLLGRKTIIINNPDGRTERSQIYSFAFKHTDLLVPWSNWSAQEHKAQFPEIPDEKIVVLHPGINLSDWPMRKPHSPGARFKLLFVGGDFIRKGGDTLLDAFSSHLQDNCELVIATQSALLPVPIRERIAQMEHVTLHLDLTSNSDQLKQLYRDTDCFVMPTTGDASPWVALESMATGIPIIISDVGGIPDMVIDGETGLLVQPNDPAAIAKAVRRIQNDPEFASRLTRQGRAHVEAHYSAATNTERFLSIIKTLVDHRRHN